MRSVLALLVLLALPAARGEGLENQIIVVANANQQESIELAAHYAKARGIATNRICLLDLPVSETMSRGFYEERLRNPLLAFLRKGGFIQQVQRSQGIVRPHESGWSTVRSDVRFVALIRGVPLRVADSHALLGQRAAVLLNTPMARNDAAVESELALALSTSYDIEGRVANFFYDQVRWADLGSGSKELLMVTRLDGPDAATVRRMIDDAVHAERHGLWGRAYFDTRGLRDTSYLIGDRWLREAAARVHRDGWSVVVDLNDQTWGMGFPMEHCALYMGWYAEKLSGPFARTNFAFARGAFAYHNHSGNAKTLRDTSIGWVAPLLAKGACCTMGATAEPYLTFTPNMQIFMDRWVSGLTFAESAYMALTALSWQTAIVGDPLYRPFARPMEQLGAEMERQGDPDLEWAWLQAANRLVLEGRLNIALALLRDRLHRTDSVVLRERLADLCLANELLDDAEKEYRLVVERAKTAETAFTAANKLTTLLRLTKRADAADQMAQSLRTRFPGSIYQGLAEAPPK